MKKSLPDMHFLNENYIRPILKESFLTDIWESIDWNLKIKVISSMANPSRTSPKEILDMEILNYDFEKH